jgi:hypothetical protein
MFKPMPTDEPPPMPLFVRLVTYAIAMALLVLAALMTWRILHDDASLWHLWSPMLCVFATVGLLRRVAWGRFLVSFINVMLTFMIAAALIPDHDDNYTGGPLLEQLLGHMPPNWIAWIIVVASTVLVLLPSVLIGFRKRWFRSAWW